MRSGDLPTRPIDSIIAFAERSDVACGLGTEREVELEIFPSPACLPQPQLASAVV